MIIGAAGAIAGCQADSPFSRSAAPGHAIESPRAALAAIRESRDPALRRAAFEYMGNTRNFDDEVSSRDEITTILGLALQAEPDVQNRAVIVQSIARLEASKQIEALLPALQDSEPVVRAMACRKLGQARAVEAVAKLDSLLVSDPSLDVRLAAADALGHIPTRDSAISLLSGISDSDVAMRHRCRESLRQLTGKDYADNIAEWRDEIQATNFEETASSTRRFGLF